MFFFWVFPAFLLGAGEFDLLPVGNLVDNVQATYYFETIGILLTALCVPLSLKLFSLVLKKKIDNMTITLALKRYVQWSIVDWEYLKCHCSQHPMLLFDIKQYRQSLYAHWLDGFSFLSAQ